MANGGRQEIPVDPSGDLHEAPIGGLLHSPSCLLGFVGSWAGSNQAVMSLVVAMAARRLFHMESGVVVVAALLVFVRLVPCSLLFFLYSF